jgi:ribonuclease VapC
VIVDTSALIAILRGEPEADRFSEQLLAAPSVHVSAGTLLEARLVAARDGGLKELAELVQAIGAVIVPVDETQIDAALDGFLRFGKGRHSAGLNFGDLFAYALARSREEPLLFKGGDFGLTDIAGR